MKYILIWFISTGQGPATSSAEFNTKFDCESARLELVDKTPVYKAICIAKGEDK